jgi:hypothetical protein
MIVGRTVLEVARLSSRDRLPPRMSDSGQTRDPSGRTASRSNPQRQQQARQSSPPAGQGVVPPSWDASVAPAPSWEPAKDAAIVPIETAVSDASIRFEWKQVAVETNRTCSCVVSVDGGHALSVRVQQPPYDRTLKGTGSVNVAAIPVASTGAKGRLVARDEVSGATAEFTWEWKPASKAKWANPSRAMRQSAAAVTSQQGAVKAEKKAEASSSGAAAVKTQQGAAVQTAFFGVPAVGRRFAFILDISGSMEMNDRWGACVRQVAVAFENLTADSEMFVVLFSDHLVVPTERAEWLPATDENKQRILEWLEHINPGGGTYPKPAFDLVFSSPSGKPDVIYFLTDGLFTEPSPERLARLCSGGDTGILASVKELFIRSDTNVPDHTVIHTLTLDDASGASICKKIAKATGGQYAHVSS